MSTKDKEKVIGEELSPAQIARFLDLHPHNDENVDFHILEKAYRGLTPNTLDQFLTLFKNNGRDINATNRKGQTLISIVQQHDNQPGYLDILKNHGAQ